MKKTFLALSLIILSALPAIAAATQAATQAPFQVPTATQPTSPGQGQGTPTAQAPTRTARTTQPAAQSGQGTSQTLVCQPAENGVQATAPVPSSDPNAPAPVVAGAAGGGTGYIIRVRQPQGAAQASAQSAAPAQGAQPASAMSAMLSFQAPQQGRGALAGYADVSRLAQQDPTVALELKNTDQSPFQFDLVVSATKDPSGWREATLVGADLFGGGALTNVPYQCRVSRD